MSAWGAWRAWRGRHPYLSVAVYSLAAFVMLAAAGFAVGFGMWAVGLASTALF